MPVSPDVAPEIISKITNFYPGRNPEKVTTRGESLGQIGDCKLSYRLVRFQLRAEGVKDKPLIPQFTKQPVLVLEILNEAVPLAYAADINALGEQFAGEVVKRIDVFEKAKLD